MMTLRELGPGDSVYYRYGHRNIGRLTVTRVTPAYLFAENFVLSGAFHRDTGRMRGNALVQVEAPTPELEQSFARRQSMGRIRSALQDLAKRNFGMLSEREMTLAESYLSTIRDLFGGAQP